jgi:hypothetical protein
MRRSFVALALATLVLGQSKQTGEDPGTRLVNYEVDGSVHSASLTYNDPTGEAKQKTVELPYKDQFFAPYGFFAYLSAQKRALKKIDNSYVNPREVTIDDGRSGTLHVLIRVGGVPLRETQTEEPFGIATASGKVEK